MSETDKEFVERMAAVLKTGTRGSFEDFNRLFTLARRGAAMTPRPIEDAPKDREVIGVERPPCENKNYFYMGQWNEERQQFMADAGYDFNTGERRWAFCGVTHYIDPDAVPLLPEYVFEEGDYDD